jgi:small subunit ribosomal protein S2
MSGYKFSMRELLEAGVHFGHHPRRWNPKMEQYIFGVRNNVHILDLQQTVPMLQQALDAIKNTIAAGGRILFVGTKRQAADKIAEVATSTGQYYVNYRWLGGMLTNWETISKSIKRLENLEKIEQEGCEGLTKKEQLSLQREKNKLDLTLGGIRELSGRPSMLFVIDTHREDLAVTEANKLGIPVIGIVDTNSNPEKIDFPIPGNDDASRAIDLYCRLAAAAVLEGLQAEISQAGVDLGESEFLPEAEMEAIAEVTEAKEQPVEENVSEEALAEK